MEWLVLCAFGASLLLCIILDRSILYALCFGLLLFLLYGRRKGFSWRELAGMVISGVATVKNILITFLLIGVLTAVWRAAGTIPVIVCYASGWIRPSVFLLMAFLLNSAVSFLTGTSFGTAATMGVICAAMGTSMGVSPVLTGGAVLSGAFFGDRCSPVSTSALLVAAVTKTDIYQNIRGMLRSALVPFLLTCALYFAMGLRPAQAGELMDLRAVFAKSFALHWSSLLPAAVILALSLMRVNMKAAMAASILTAVPLCLFLQHISAAGLLRAAVFGFTPSDPEAAAMMSGGGILSMLRVAGIVCISSGYSDLFRRTGLLDSAKESIARLADRTTPFIATLVTSAIAGMIACNQTLTILLTNQLCGELHAGPGSGISQVRKTGRDAEPHAGSGADPNAGRDTELHAGADSRREQFAIDLEDTAVVVAPLVPWSIAGAVPLSAIGAPSAAILAAAYLYLIPLWRAVVSWAGRRPGRADPTAAGGSAEQRGVSH